MQTALSIPNPIYETVNRLASQEGRSLSELVTTALTSYVTQYHPEELTDQLNQVYKSEGSSVDTIMMIMQLASVPKEEW